MSKPLHFVGERVAYWDDGNRIEGMIFSAKRTVFGRIKYIVSVEKNNGFDTDGIGRKTYRYYPIMEDSIIETLEEPKNNAY